MAGAWSSKGRRGVATAVALIAIASVVAPAADAKKKKITIVGTTTTAVPLAAGGQASNPATCGKGLHITGGGFSISPQFASNGSLTLADDSGVRSLNQVS